MAACCRIQTSVTANGRTIRENCEAAENLNPDVIKTVAQPDARKCRLHQLARQSLRFAIMKTSVISPEFRQRYLSNPDDPEAFEGRAVVFEGPEDYHARIDDPTVGIDEHYMLFIRGGRPGRLSGGSRSRQHAAAGLSAE